jgi:pyrimidine operon attenuation protein/uracil phosphoribosyltransferase
MIEKHQSISLEIGSLDITFYRDDLKHISEFPTVYSTNINFPIEAREIALIDDVLYTGRTVKAALDAIFDLGRPKKISMTALIDQGHRELPIRADFVGKLVPTSRKEIVHVHMQEIDDDDGVYISEGL